MARKMSGVERDARRILREIAALNDASDKVREAAQPVMLDGLPMCAYDDCAQYDGKRCRLMGFRPGHICEPAAREIVAELDAARAELARLREALRSEQNDDG